MNKSDEHHGMSIILTILFKRAWPVWTLYQGEVPDDALRQLEIDGDWPRGLAAAIMQRIGRDTQVRKQLEESC